MEDKIEALRVNTGALSVKIGSFDMSAETHPWQIEVQGGSAPGRGFGKTLTEAIEKYEENVRKNATRVAEGLSGMKAALGIR